MNTVLFSKILNESSNETPLLIFHGLFGLLDNWQTLGLKFAETRSVHLIDLRNHGRSFHSETMNYKAFSDDILEYLQFHHIEKCILLGHSLGGKAVMEFAVKNPEKTEKLVVADIAPKAYPPHHQSIIKALQSVDFSKIEKRSEVEAVLQQYIPEISVRQFLLKSVYRKDDETYDFRFNINVIAQNYSNLIEKSITNISYVKPTLFIRGGNSHYISDEDFHFIQKQFPQAILATIPNAGHWLHAENPDKFFEITQNFIISQT